MIRGVLLDFAGTLFVPEPAEATLRAVGVDELRWPELMPRYQAQFAYEPALSELPPELVDPWTRRDLSSAEHRAAYLGLDLRSGTPPEIAIPMYERINSADAWVPFDDTEAALRELRTRGLPVAIVSNFSWDLRQSFERYGLLELVDAFVLSFEVNVMKPDPRIFQLACDAIAVSPRDALMVGDSVKSDGGAVTIGAQFVPVGSPRGAGDLLRALRAALPDTDPDSMSSAVTS